MWCYTCMFLPVVIDYDWVEINRLMLEPYVIKLEIKRLCEGPALASCQQSSGLCLSHTSLSCQSSDYVRARLEPYVDDCYLVLRYMICGYFIHAFLYCILYDCHVTTEILRISPFFPKKLIIQSKINAVRVRRQALAEETADQSE